MSESVYVIVTGHHQEAKCDVANALLHQKQFRPFACRKNNAVKSRKTTVLGKPLCIVATPALDTPSWTIGKRSFRKFKSKLFLYVKVNDLVDSDDKAWVDCLEKEFGDKRRQRVIPVFYNIGKRAGVADTHGNSDICTGAVHFGEELLEDTTVFHKTDTLEMKIETADKILRDVVKILEAPARPAVTNFGAEMSVDAKRKSEDTMSISSVSLDSESDISSIMDSVNFHRSCSEEPSSLLPDLDDKDWKLYRQTLQNGKARTYHIRVNIMGNQGAGKTTLVKRLQEVEVVCPDRMQRSTEILEINQINTKCTEKGGERVWETNDRGFEEESNLQRMSFALKYVEEMQGSDQFTFQETQSELEMLEMGSEECEEHGDVVSSVQYGAQIDNQQKDRYLRQVKKWRSNNCENERVYLSYWDFAGQTTYYSTHQVFLAPSVVYLLVINLNQEFSSELKDSLSFRTGGIPRKYTVEETVKFWISSIKAYTRNKDGGNAPLIVVGTHKDKVTEDQIREKFAYIRRVTKGIAPLEFVAVDNTKPLSRNEALQDLRNKILDEGLGVIDSEIPAQWIDLEKSLMFEKERGKTVIKFSDLEELDRKSDVPIADSKQLIAFLDYQQSRGLLLHFCHIGLEDVIILDPSLLTNIFNTLLRDTRSLSSSYKNENGIVHQDFVNEAVARDFPQCSPQLFTKLLQELHIMHEYKDGLFFVPCLLPHRDLQAIEKANINKRFPTVTMKLLFKDAFVPPAFFHLLVSALKETDALDIRETEGGCMMYNLYVCFRYHVQTCWLEVYWNECEVFFKVTNYSPCSFHLVQPERNLIEDLVTIINKKATHVLAVFRQVHTKYVLQVECPEHKGRFIDLASLIADKDYAMCLDKESVDTRHALSWSDIIQSVSSQLNVSPTKMRPTGKILGRLARQLSRESPRSMTSKLRISDTIADQAEIDSRHSPTQRLHVLKIWAERNPEKSLEELLKNFSTGGYGEELSVYRLMEDIRPVVEPRLSAVIDSPPTQKQLMTISDIVGVDYPFLMLELDISLVEIDRSRAENKGLRDIVWSLLLSWQQQNAEKATLRQILNVAHHLQMGYTDMVKKLEET